MIKQNRFSFFLAVLCIAAASLQLVLSAKTRYDDYRLVRLAVENAKQAELVASWEMEDEEFDIWNSGNGKSAYVDVLLSPLSFGKYASAFELNSISYDILQANIQNLIEDQERSMARSQLLRNNIINKFATYTEILGFVDDIVRNNPNIASSYITGNTTVENRILKVVVLKTAQSSKPVWIDCGIHAREWVSPATCVYFIDTLVNEYNNNPSSSLLNTYEFHILPLVNPDGYSYSITNTRLWRKNRRMNSGSSCVGVDLNRNYDFQWMVNGGASSNPCSTVFAGPSPDSEAETKAVEAAINKRAGEWTAFFTIHSYGQWWLIGYGHNTVQIPDYDDLYQVGKAAADEIAAATSDNTKYVAGQSSVLLYINSGCSQDWAKGKANIKYSYTIELRPGQNSPDASYGFTLPENRLPKLTLETLAGVKAALAEIDTIEN